MGADQQAQGENLEARADSLFSAGQLPEAALLYRKILRREPGRLDIQARLGRLALLDNNPPQAITQLAAVLNQGLRTKANWGALADAYLAHDELGPAALCYERAGRTGLAGTLAVMADRVPWRITGAVDAVELGWLAQTAQPIIQAEVNGTRVNLLVDTAARDLVLDAEVAIAAGIPHGGRESLHFAGGQSAMVTYGQVERLQLGALTIHDVLTQILDLQNGFAAYTPAAPIHGILGIAILSRFLTVLDFQRRTLRLQAVTATMKTASRGGQQNASPMWLADNQFVLVRAETPSHASAMWVIDTGMTGAGFAVSASTAESLGLAPRGGEGEEGLGGGGAVQGKRVILPTLRLGGIEPAVSYTHLRAHETT